MEVEELSGRPAEAVAGGGERARKKHLARGKLLPRDRVEALLDQKGDPVYSAARLWDDGIIDPLDTPPVQGPALTACANAPLAEPQFGIFRM